MSKQDLIADAPPPYSPTGEPSSSRGPIPLPPQSLDPNFFSATLRTHLSTIPSRIRTSSARNTSRQITSDLAIISLLVPHIESFLSAAAHKAASLDTPGTKPLVGSLILIPSAAVPAGAQMGDARERRQEGEYVRIVRVETSGDFFGSEKGSFSPATGDQKTGSRLAGGEGEGEGSVGKPRALHADETDGELRAWDRSRDESFDSWGRFGTDFTSSPHEGHGNGDDDFDNCSNEEKDGRKHMWWNDEPMVKRLAGYLQPAPVATNKLERKTVQKAVVEGKKEKKSWFGLGKTSKKEVIPKRAEDVVVVDEVQGAEDERVSIIVSAQELSFQQENEFGVYESIGGWGIVLRVKIKRA